MEGEANSENIHSQVLIPVMVDHGWRLGKWSDVVGTQFILADLFGRDARMLGSDAYSELYINVDDRNIIRLDATGRYVNLLESVGVGEIVYHHLVSSVSSTLERETITIGEQFMLDEKLTIIPNELVAVTQRYYNRDILETMTHGRSSDIVDRFRHFLRDQCLEDEYLGTIGQYLESQS